MRRRDAESRPSAVSMCLVFRPVVVGMAVRSTLFSVAIGWTSIDRERSTGRSRVVATNPARTAVRHGLGGLNAALDDRFRNRRRAALRNASRPAPAGRDGPPVVRSRSSDTRHDRRLSPTSPDTSDGVGSGHGPRVANESDDRGEQVNRTLRTNSRGRTSARTEIRLENEFLAAILTFSKPPLQAARGAAKSALRERQRRVNPIGPMVYGRTVVESGRRGRC